MDQNKFGSYQVNLEGMASYLKENEKSQESSGGGVSWWNIPRGMSSVRILPPWDPTGRIALPVYTHPIEYQGEGMKYKKYNWTCVNKTFGKPCNICEGLNSIAAAGVDISSYEPTRRTFYYNAIVMYDPDFDRDSKMGKKPEDCGGVAPGTHVLMKSPKVVYDWIVAQITNPMVGDLTSVTNGIDIFITKEGSGLGTTYSCTLSPSGRQPIPQEYLDKIESLYNLDEVFGTGFEQDQVNALVASLNTSSNVFNNSGISNASNQMAGQMAGYQTPPQVSGYQFPPQTPTQSFQAVPQSMPQTPPFQATPPAFGAPAFGAPSGVMPGVVQPQQPSPSVGSMSDKPDCYGNYNPTSVKCVTCPSEIACQKDSNR